MGCFDLNIPYPESSPANKTTVQSNRTKLAVKAMELGYTGIAYNRTIKGVMSDQHRCSISPLSLSSLLNVVPFLSLSAKLHRNLLGTPLSTPFRQYTRLTVCVDSATQGQALNSGNPILKTYDLVAVRPLNQIAFDLSCERMEVDIISIDFSTKLPFRLKQSMIKTATQRGVCFEVTYSGLFADIQMRRQLMSSAKLLMDWTRGQNIVFSSAAASVNELRGPCDVANLLSLFGLSKERANAAISKNCRILLTNSLRKKRFYKEAIRVEVLSSDTSHSKEDRCKELLKWDPISSGEGDIMLDDMEKTFSPTCKVSKTAKAIDFDSVVDSLPSHGFEIKDLLPANNAFSVCPDSKANSPHVAQKLNQSAAVPNKTEQPYKLDGFAEQDENSSADAIKTHHVSSCDNSFEKDIHSGITEAFKFKEPDTPTDATKLELKNFIYSNVPMDNMAKSFLASCTVPKATKAIDSVSVANSIPSHDCQIKDFLPANDTFPAFPDNKLNFPPVAKKENQLAPVLNNLTVLPNRLDSPKQDESSQPQKQNDKFLEQNTYGGTVGTFTSREIDISTNVTELELKTFVDSDAVCIPLEPKAVESPSNSCISSRTLDTVEQHKNTKLHGSSEDAKLDNAHNIGHKVDNFTPSTDIVFPALVHYKHNGEKSSGVNLNEQFDKMCEALPNKDSKIAEQTILEFNTSISETSMEDVQFSKLEPGAGEHNEMQQPISYDEMKIDDDSTSAKHILPEVNMEDEKLDELSTGSDQFASIHSVSGQLRVKRRRTSRGTLLLPFKRVWNPMPFKKKCKRSKSRTKLS